METCKGMYCYSVGAHCFYKDAVRSKALYGFSELMPNNTPEERARATAAFEAYKDIMREQVLPLCQHPEKLEEALNSIEIVLPPLE